MRSSSHALSFGANMGFAHMHCAKCGEERLHKHCRCVSCHTLHATSGYKPLEWVPRNPGELNIRQRKANAAKRKDHA